jgi:hypothetical protein
MILSADFSGRTLSGVGLRPPDGWNRGFEIHWRQECSSLVPTACSAGSALCDKMITRLEKSYRMCVRACLIVRELEPSKEAFFTSLAQTRTSFRIESIKSALLSFTLAVQQT